MAWLFTFCVSLSGIGEQEKSKIREGLAGGIFDRLSLEKGRPRGNGPYRTKGRAVYSLGRVALLFSVCVSM